MADNNSTAVDRFCQCGKRLSGLGTLCHACRPSPVLTDEEWSLIQRFRRESLAAEAASHPDGKHRIWGYRRCSHEDSKQTRGGLTDQTNRIELAAKSITAEHDDVVWGKWFDDEAVSASVNAFSVREGASAMMRAAKSGDYIIVSDLDRAFRDTVECLNTIKECEQRGIHFKMLNPAVDTSSPVGLLITTVIAGVAKFEAQRVGERTRRAFAAKRAAGYCVSARLPFGYKLVGPKGFRRKVPMLPHEFSPLMRKIMGMVVELHDLDPERWTWGAIAWYLRRWWHTTRRQEKKAVTTRFAQWSKGDFRCNFPSATIARMYAIEKEIREQEKSAVG